MHDLLREFLIPKKLFDRLARYSSIAVPGRVKFATNAPQTKTGQFGQWRISAGYRGQRFCGKF
jgi:hypothetical protein